MTTEEGQVPEEEKGARDEKIEGTERTEGAERVEESSGATEESEPRKEDTDQVAEDHSLDDKDPESGNDEIAGDRPFEQKVPEFRMMNVDEITVPENRLRTPREEDVEMYVESIRQCGCIRVPLEVTRNNVLISGAGRLAAARTLGFEQVPVICHEQEDCNFSDAERELGEIDENLIRKELNPLEKALHIARRYRALEKLGWTIAERGQSKGDMVMTKTEFAKMIGMGKSTLKVYLSLAKNLDGEASYSLMMSPIADSKVDLIRISKLPPEDQRTLAVNIAFLALSPEEARSIIDDYLAPPEPEEEIPVTDETDGGDEADEADGGAESPDVPADREKSSSGSEGDKVDSEPVSEPGGEQEADTVPVDEPSMDSTPETNMEESADPKRRDAVEKWLNAAGTSPETGTREEFLAAALELVCIVRELRSGESPRITRGNARYLELKGFFPELFQG